MKKKNLYLMVFIVIVVIMVATLLPRCFVSAEPRLQSVVKEGGYSWLSFGCCCWPSIGLMNRKSRLEVTKTRLKRLKENVYKST